MSVTDHAPRAPRIFYGWLLVGAGAVFGSFLIGGAQFATSIFAPPMHAEFGWSRTVLFGALTLRGLLAGLLAPLVGPLADHRWAPRVAIPVGSVLLGLSFVMGGTVQTPLEYYVWYAGVGGLGMALAGHAVVDAVVTKWFLRKRPQALMWLSVGPATGPLFFPVLLTTLVATVGWRDGWVWLGLATIIVLLPLGLMMRTRPEDMGLLPDGERPASGFTASGRPARHAEEYSFGRAEALRTRSLWLLAVAGGLGVFGIPGFQAHWLPYFQDIGFSAEVAALAVSFYGIFAVVARFVYGYLSGRFPIRNVFVAQALLAALGTAAMLVIQNVWMLFIWAALMGINLGAFFQLQALTAVTYFGRDHIGAIRGLMGPFSTVSIALAPLVLGLLRDWQGSYAGGLLLVTTTWLLSALLLFLSRPPRPATADPVATPAGGERRAAADGARPRP
jgi:sugar phosphate permease